MKAKIYFSILICLFFSFYVIGKSDTLMPGFPVADGTVYSMVLLWNLLCVGGTFTSIGGQSRNGIGAVYATTGSPSSWNPNLSGSVGNMVIGNEVQYVGGQFTSNGCLPRLNHMGSILTTGNLTSRNQNDS